jgi:hypothetical protein
MGCDRQRGGILNLYDCARQDFVIENVGGRNAKDPHPPRSQPGVAGAIMGFLVRMSVPLAVYLNRQAG